VGFLAFALPSKGSEQAAVQCLVAGWGQPTTYTMIYWQPGNTTPPHNQ